MKFLFLLVFLLIVTGAGAAMLSAAKAHLALSERWKVVSVERGDETVVELVRGSSKDVVGSVTRMSDDYTDQLIDLTADAEARRDERNALLNSQTKRLGR